MKLIVMLLAAVVLLLSASTTYQFIEAREARTHIQRNTDKNCRDQHSVVRLLSLFLEEGAKQFQVRPATTPESAAQIEAFQVRAGKLLKEADCILPSEDND